MLGHLNGPLEIASVAGSGKTLIICFRISALTRSGVDPERILAVTFSVKAAKEMNKRLTQLGLANARISTFHALCLSIVRSEIPELARWQIDDRDHYRNVVKDALGYRFMDWKDADLTLVLSFIGRCKAAAVLPGTPDAMELATRLYRPFRSPQRDPALLARAYFTAEELRRERQLLTYDDMLLEGWHLLNSDEGARKRWAQRFDHVIQDECQDENPVQRMIATLLAKDHRNYMVVGDPAQSIYGFRGSDPGGMLRFAKEWNAPVVGMSRNYRSAPIIIEAANRVIEAMDPATHLGVKLVAERDFEGQLTVTRFPSFDEEGEGIATHLQQQHVDGRAWRDCAVLYRTNAQSRGIEEALLTARIPYVVVGGVNFYQRREVRDLLAYLRVATGRGTFDDVKRSINTPFRFLGKAFVEGLEAAGRQCGDDEGWTTIVRRYIDSGRSGLQQRQKTSALQWCALIDQLAANSTSESTDHVDKLVESKPARMLESLIMDIQYTQWLQRDEGTESPENNKISNVRELVRAAERFPTVGELLDYIDDTLHRAQLMKRNGDSVDCVTLTSLHRSKGLEWPVVYLIGCNEKIIPHARAGDDHEERRLFYVGVTRARDELHLSCLCRAAVGTRVLELQPSRFLMECQLTVQDHDSCRADFAH